MAPEVIQGKGYTLSVDYWSLGICLYEFLCGHVPYEDDDPFKIYQLIIKSPVKIPEFMDDLDAKDLIMKLLNKNPKYRL
jgi:cGMP-dependent protein kinase